MRAEGGFGDPTSARDIHRGSEAPLCHEGSRASVCQPQSGMAEAASYPPSLTILHGGNKLAFVKRALLSILFLFLAFSDIFAVDVAPRISDREIVERLARLEEGQKTLNKRIDDLRSEMNDRFAIVDKRIDDLRSEMNGRFDTLQWTLGLFITIALVILGFVLRLQWQMARRQTQMETVLETHKDELTFLKGLIEKLLPPRGTL